MRPQRPHATDLNADSPFVTEGLLAGTPLATPDGWRLVEEIGPGDLVLTFDGGPRRVQAVQSALVEAGRLHWPMSHWPLAVPARVLGNRDRFRLLPDQAVLLDCDLAEDMFGDPFALIPAAALQGWRGIAPEPPEAREQVVTPVMAEDEVIYAAGGALIWCPGDQPAGLPMAHNPRGDRAGYAPLSLASARELVACLIAQDVGAALSGAAPGGYQAALRALSP
jgi:hypothetical protein